jgi:hypothetical protein
MHCSTLRPKASFNCNPAGSRLFDQGSLAAIAGQLQQFSLQLAGTAAAAALRSLLALIITNSEQQHHHHNTAQQDVQQHDDVARSCRAS